MTKSEIYNTLKTKQLHHAIHASKLAIECADLKGEELESTKRFAKQQYIKSTTLLGAINELLGADYKGYKVMNTQNELLLEQWNESERERLGL